MQVFIIKKIHLVFVPLVGRREAAAMRRVVIDMQNYLFADAIARTLKDYDSDFLTEMPEAPEKTAELCRVIQSNILMMEVTRQTPWKLEERMQICREVKRSVPDCKIILGVDEKSDKEIAAMVVEYKKMGLIDCFIYNTISASYLTALIDTL